MQSGVHVVFSSLTRRQAFVLVVGYSNCLILIVTNSTSTCRDMTYVLR